MPDVNKQLLDALKEIQEFNRIFIWSPRIGELCNKAIAAAEQVQTVPAQQGECTVAYRCTNSDSWNCKYCRKTESCKAINDQQNYGAAVKSQQQDERDVRCECCGYMTYHREHLGCIRAAQKGNT